MGDYLPYTTGPLRGLNENLSPDALAPGDLKESINACRFGEMYGTRPGTIRPASGEDYENKTTGGNPIQLLYEYRKNFDEDRVMIAIGDDGGSQNVFHEDAALLTAGPTITAGQDNIWTADIFNNTAWFAGGAASDDFFHWDGNTSNAPVALELEDSASARIRPKYVKQYSGYLLINGLRGGVLADNNPMVTRFCTFSEDPTDKTKWAVGNTVGFSTNRTGYLDAFGKVFSTGFGEYEDIDGKWLLLLTNKGIVGAVLDESDDFRTTDGIATGCVSQRAYVNLGLDASDAVYMSEQGIHSLRQSQTFGSRQDQFISWKIAETFKTLNKGRLKFAVAAYDRLNGRVVFAVSTGSNTGNDTLLVLDLSNETELTAKSASWSIWKLRSATGPLHVNELLYARDDTSAGEYHLYAGTDEGDVIRFTDTVYNDLTVGTYAVAFTTRDDPLGTHLQEKGLGDVNVVLQPGGTYKPTCQFMFDFGNTKSKAKPMTMKGTGGAVWGTGVWGTDFWTKQNVTRTESLYGVGKGHTIGFRFAHSGNNEPFRVGRTDFEAMVTGKDAGSES